MEQKLFTVEYKHIKRGYNWSIDANVVSNHFNIEAISFQAGDFGVMKERAKDAINAALEQCNHAHRVKDKEIEYSPKF